jgi:CubicO group peptidase (beta-lactamase class C family)
MKFKSVRYFFAGIFLLAVVCCSITANAQLDTAALSSKLERARERLGKDAVFLLYKDGKIIYKKELGNANLKTQQPIGAASQWLTTALVMTFVQEERLSLDDKVSDYLPIFSKHGKGYITIRHCLTHNTGIQSNQGVLKFLQKSKFKTLEEEVNDYASKREIETNPGTEFKYSNMGFEIAGRVLEVITKKPFDRLIQERLIRNLTMRNTTFANEDYNDAVSPSTGARSSGADYINFLSMLLNKGMFNNKVILNEGALVEMFSIKEVAGKMKNTPKLMAGLDYGLGEWVLEESAGKPTAFTSPSLFGTWPIVDLCRGYAFVLLTKELSGEQRMDIITDIKADIDGQFAANCGN